ncbi:rubrerythrin [Parasulfuritortus cantonensis]|uniref:Rubrerythrin n=1 Tax=Parasulfuritortus cantonensis TaxID=2528202 RepID=A0A4R1BNA1_9PROT|nr:ferritin family protein [Parasulfuritortus cantonensis]TCJ18931.1 rubrerythrin [Parasulfuritortus cantonensis]
MSEHEGTSSGVERLRATKTLKEILDVATSFEATARDFYTALVPKVGKNLRWLVEDLAKEEAGHYTLFSGLAARPDLERLLQAEVATPASDRRFSDAVLQPDLGERPDDQAILQYALAREHTAMEQYRALAENTEPGPFKELFEYLANEETKHKNELERLYYETVHSGGV